jgi:hypothetical protein
MRTCDLCRLYTERKRHNSAREGGVIQGYICIYIRGVDSDSAVLVWKIVKHEMCSSSSSGDRSSSSSSSSSMCDCCLRLCRDLYTRALLLCCAIDNDTEYILIVHTHEHARYVTATVSLSRAVACCCCCAC